MIRGPITGNAAALFAARLVAGVGAIATFAIAASRLDSEAFGIAVAVIAVGAIANSLVTFGSDTVIVRAIAGDEPNGAALARTGLRMQLGAAVVLFAVALVCVAVGANVAIAVQAGALAPLAVITIASAVLRGRQTMNVLAAGHALGSVVTLAAVVLATAVSTEAWSLVAAIGIGAIATAVVLGRAGLDALDVIDSDDATNAVKRIDVRTLIAMSSQFAAMVVLAAFGAHAGPVLVELVSSDTAGGYGVAIRLTEAARLLPAAVIGALFPAMVAQPQAAAVFRRWYRSLGVYALVAAGLLVVLAGPANRLLFSSQPDGAVLIRILGIGLIATVARMTISTELIAAGDERRVTRSALVGAIVAVGGGLVVAPRFGAPGIAVAQVVGVVAAVGALMAPRRALARSRIGT